ncbi:glycogen synthase GlgA [Acidisoma cellulosilytica]|uniref:Glycogen synthase n=1 Tax=Acidisoma cellulosilyticum TaxID=2802395 RepID=A0A964E2E5_9PROT|nr:glycogen synthase GlgA [Acidisoma cellulosilyticum]MCB8878748.1 glycogen synthase GlgA [Acidisoma cellulosilyticum]
MELLSITSEFFPLIKTGGLADVAGALPAALAPEGVNVTTLLPGYPAVMKALQEGEPVHEVSDLFGGPAWLWRGRCGKAPLIVIDAPHLFDRPGNPYLDASGRDWPDNPQRFAALAYTGAAIARGLMPGYLPDVVHGHDWQAGLMPAYLHFSGDAADAGTTRPPSVMTVHNLAFQGLCDPGLLGALRLPPQAFSIQGVEYFGRISFLKAGLRLANHVTTVSPTYAREICTPEGGMGLDGLLRGRGTALSGILNGIDTDVWNPETDAALPQRFSEGRLNDRTANKAALCARFGLEPDRLLFGIVSRLTTQKGLDLLPASLSTLRAIGASVVVLGAGAPELERAYAQAARPGEMGLFLGYDEALAHLIYAGTDALLIPSRFEPCGLTQLCAMRYGCLPVVTRVGGLADTVIDANEAAIGAGVATGFQMDHTDSASLDLALRRVAHVWGDRTAWERMQRNALTAEVGWSRSAARYAELYRGLVA